MASILEKPKAEVETWLKNRKQPRFRYQQIVDWVVRRRATVFDEMTDLPKQLRQELHSEFQIWTTRIARHQRAEDGTEKLLLQMSDGGRIECVLLKEGIRRTVCISSQVGCAMGCVFCASGLDGVDRNLSAHEIFEQLLRLQALLVPEERLSHVVVMGMGEPLANLDNLLPALEKCTSETGLGIGARRITISTVGLPQAIDRLADVGRQYHLAVSLHAPNDTLRNRLVPVNKNIGIDSIIQSAQRFFERSGRRLTFEYVLLAEVNDQPAHAKQLAAKLHGMNALLNVIPYNPVEGLPYRTPNPEAIREFRDILLLAGINLKFRQRKGDKINAACGQLRRSNQQVIALEG